VSLEGLECQASKSVGIDACPRPTTGAGSIEAAEANAAAAEVGCGDVVVAESEAPNVFVNLV
jgi:hypothetical protein